MNDILPEVSAAITLAAAGSVNGKVNAMFDDWLADASSVTVLALAVPVAPITKLPTFIVAGVFVALCQVNAPAA
jgi:hypothetical protein